MKRDHKDIIKEKIPITNIRINKDFTRYNAPVKTYMPDNGLKEVFKNVFEESDLDISEIDEIRKIYFLYFKQNMELISEFKLTKIVFPFLGKISPNIDEFCKYIDRISKGYTATTNKHRENVALYNKFLVTLKMLIKEHQGLYIKNGHKELIKYDDNFIHKKNIEWKRNFYKRNIKFKPTLISEGLFLQ